MSARSVVLLGIREPRSRHFEVAGLKDPEKVVRELWTLLDDRTKLNVNLLSEDQVSIIALEGRGIVRIQIPRAPRKKLPVFLHGNPLTGSFRRLHDGDHPCSEEEVRRMMAEAADAGQDGRVLEHFGWKDLDLESLAAYRNTFRAFRPTHPFANQEDEAFLQSIGGWGEDRERGWRGLTVAGLLMFGKWRSIVEEFPNYVLDYRDLPADPQTVRYLDRLVTDGLWSGNVYDFYRRVYGKLTADLKVPFRLKGDERQEESPVHEAIREGLVNCLIHADYHGRRSVLVLKRPGLFSFRNPGRMRVPVEQAIRGGESDCRNRVLQNMFFLAGRGDRLGSGIPTIFQNWKGQHWRQPEIWEDLEPEEQTSLRLRTESLLPKDALAAVARRFGDRFKGLGEVERVALVTVEVEGFLTHSRLAQLCEMHPHDLSRLLAHLVEEGFLESDKRGRGTSYRFPGTADLQAQGTDGGAGSPRSTSTHLAPRSSPLGASSSHLASSSSHLGGSSSHSFPESRQGEEEAPEESGDAPLPPAEDPQLSAMAATIRSRGKAPEQEVRAVILRLCRGRYLTLRDLAGLLGRTPANLRNRYLSPMVQARLLEWRFPTQPNHEQQAYRTVEEG